MSGLKTLTELGQLMGQGTAINEERLLSFIAVYRRDNNDTPTYAAMANQLGILEEGVRILLARLENKGRLHFISRNPPRIMLLGPDTLLPHEPTAADLAAAKPGAYGRFLDAEAERHRLGRFIATTERTAGRGPSLREMIDFVGWAPPARVQRMAEMLAEKGLVQFGRGVPTKLTALGRQLYGLKEVGEMQHQQKVIVVPLRRQTTRAKIDLLCKALAARCRADAENGPYTKYADLCTDMGYAPTSTGMISEASREAIRLGYLNDKGLKCHGLFFTEKGRAKFMPELVTPTPSPAPPVEPASTADFREAFAARGPVEYGEPVRMVESAAPSQLTYVETPALIMELIERGYTVRKG